MPPVPEPRAAQGDAPQFSPAADLAPEIDAHSARMVIPPPPWNMAKGCRLLYSMAAPSPASQTKAAAGPEGAP